MVEIQQLVAAVFALAVMLVFAAVVYAPARGTTQARGR